MQFAVACLGEGRMRFVGLQVQVTAQLRAAAHTARFAQQFPAAEQVRVQRQAQEAGGLVPGIGVLQVSVHGPDCKGRRQQRRVHG